VLHGEKSEYQGLIKTLDEYVDSLSFFFYEELSYDKIPRILPTFQPMFSKNVHSLVCPVVLPPHGPANHKRA
jgi:hypothetical protein